MGSRNQVNGESKSIAALAALLATVFLALIAATPRVGAQQADKGCWSLERLPGLGTFESVLNGVYANSPNDVWAVGHYDIQPANHQALTLHWNGKEWSAIPTPIVGRTSSLRGISGLGSNNIWAVGEYLHETMGIRTLVLHWDGREWRVVPSPNVSERRNNYDYVFNSLNAVAAISPNDVWAVGDYTGTGEKVERASDEYRPLVLHWDGTQWNIVRNPILGAEEQHLRAIAAVASNDVWAVGDYNFFDARPLIEHWGGKEWSVVSSPDPAGKPDHLRGIAALAPNDVWVVGDQDGANRALVEHWDGTRWAFVANPARSLKGIAAVRPNYIWAVGTDIWADRSSGPLKAQVTLWNGREWSLIPNLVQKYASQLNAVAAVNGAMWSVGYSFDQQDDNFAGAFILKHTDAPCSASTPTPVPSVTRPGDPPIPIPGTGSVTFRETGKTVSGIFLNYWQSHRGLAQQGYPISEVIGEMSDLKSYTMQYFERAVFEYHPENKPPYNVLLSHLGRFQLRNNYPTGTPKQWPNDQPGSILFKETNKRIGGSFLEYWRENGDLMQQGYPISDEFVEVSPLDGKPYTVQYFERAVFEYHPENKGTQYEVLLSQLGTYRWLDKYGKLP